MPQTLLTLCYTPFKLYRQLYIQKKIVAELVTPHLQGGDESLSLSDFIKIQKYYALAVPGILGHACCSLHQTKLSLSNQHGLTYLGAITGLFDDFYDKLFLPQSEIDALIVAPEQNTNPLAHVRLFVNFYTKALLKIENKALFLHYCKAVNAAQIASKAQLNVLPSAQLKTITDEKGGYSLLFYRAAVNISIGEAEKELLYRIGALMQLSNDIFDVYKDAQQGIRTLATEAKSIEGVRTLFLLDYAHCVTLAQKMALPKGIIRSFFAQINMAVFGRALVCLNFYEKQGSYKPFEMTRKQLVCDMDKASSIFASMKCSYQLLKYIG